MASRERRSRSASSATATNALLRWLTSITDMPLPRQSVSSARACSRTSSGSAAGPAAKLNTRTSALIGLGKSSRRFDRRHPAPIPSGRLTPAKIAPDDFVARPYTIAAGQGTALVRYRVIIFGYKAYTFQDCCDLRLGTRLDQERTGPSG